jgi:hypothetical protein
VSAIRSMSGRREGAERRRESRMCEPGRDVARVRMGSVSEDAPGAEGGVIRVLIRRRRNVRLEGDGRREDWRMWDVGVQRARRRIVSCGRDKSASSRREDGGPGMESRVCARREPWVCAGLGLGGGVACGEDWSPEEAAGMRVAVRVVRREESISTIFKTRVEGSEPYAEAMASVSCFVSALLA